MHINVRPKRMGTPLLRYQYAQASRFEQYDNVNVHVLNYV